MNLNQMLNPTGITEKDASDSSEENNVEKVEKCRKEEVLEKCRKEVLEKEKYIEKDANILKEEEDLNRPCSHLI